MKGYGIRFNTLEIFRNVGREAKRGNNLYKIEDITDCTYYLSDDPNITNQYAFEVEEDGDNLNSLKTGGKLYGFVHVTYLPESRSIQEQNLEYFEKGLEYWKNNSDGNNFFYCPYTIEYPSKEFPYRVYLFGSDDSSYTRCFATLQDVEDILQILSESPMDMYEFCKDLEFIFTN